MIDPTSKQPKFSQTNTRFVSLRAPKVPTSNLRDQNKTPATIIMETPNPCMQRSGQRRYTPPPQYATKSVILRCSHTRYASSSLPLQVQQSCRLVKAVTQRTLAVEPNMSTWIPSDR